MAINQANEYVIKVMKNNSVLKIQEHKNTNSITTDWGDDTVNNELTHVYKFVGEYTVKTTCRPIQEADKYYSIRIISCNVLSNHIIDCTDMFRDYTYMEISPSIPSNVQNCKNMYYGCKGLIEPPIIPAGVKICNGMFQFCYKLTSMPIIPNNVINCNKMFQYCNSLIDINQVPSTVKTCSKMFRLCSSLEKAPIIPSGTDDCSQMFEYCDSLSVLPSENVNLLTTHKESLQHERTYNGCKKLQTVYYDDIPRDWK